jgi:hypothetical protein
MQRKAGGRGKEMEGNRIHYIIKTWERGEGEKTQKNRKNPEKSP